MKTAMHLLIDDLKQECKAYYENNEIYLKSCIEMEKQQQGYSEEDMRDYANYRLLIKKALDPKEWFEQFKNK